MSQVGEIRRMHEVEGCSIREVARRLGVSRNTVRDVLRAPRDPEVKYERVNAHMPKLGPFKGQLEEILEEDWGKAARDRMNGEQIYVRLQGLGYEGAVDSVRRFARRWREERGAAGAEAFVPLVFGAGEAMQFDWSTERVMVGGVATVVKAAHVRLCHSRMCFVQVFACERQEMMLEGLRRAVHFFGGTPRRLVVDNLTAAVKKVLVGRERVWQDRFEGFCSHYLISPRACQVNTPTDKGQIERQVGVLRGQFFRAARAASLDELNERLQAQCIEWAKSTAHPEVRAMSVWQMWREEAAHLTALPPGDFECCRIEEEKRVDRFCTVAFDGCRYSVPSRLVGKSVQVRGYAGHVKLVHGGAVVATHARLFGRGEAAYDPLHYLDVLERKPGALENGRPFVQWQMPAALSAARDALGRADGEREFIKVLLLLRDYGMDDVCAATELATERGVPHASVIENILLRLSDETPPRQECTAPVTLRSEPAADPSIYDTQLRREVAR